MINIRNYFKSLLVILFILAIVWFLSLELTKQRIVLEAENKLNSVQALQSPFIWDFTHFSQDIVESFQGYWQVDLSHVIHAKQASNPQLSLNFSGQTLNTMLHNKLFIYSKKELQGRLKIQVKRDLDDSVFYYSPPITLSGKVIGIDLKQAWVGYKASGERVELLTWKKEIAKVSSLVLIFENPDLAIDIDKVVIPYSNKIITIKKMSVNCQGQVDRVQSNTLIEFELLQSCLLSSNYMWLNHKLAQQFPESILSIKGVNLWQKPSHHRVNKSYTSNIMLNTLLYGLMIFCLGVIFWQRRINKINDSVTEQEPWYKWAARQMLFKGAKTAIRPYHLSINYAVVFIPTLVVLVIMAFINFPEWQAFKKLPLYFIWAVLQQFFLGYVLAQRIFYTRTENRLLSALLAASVFSLLHMPSATLMLATFVAGGLWAYAFLVFKRLLPLALSHAVLALMFYHVVSDRVLYTAKVMQWFWE